MSLKALERVLKHSKQSGSALAAMLILAHRANAQNVCWPKEKALAVELKLEKRQTQNLMKALKDAGEIDIQRNTTGEQIGNYYLVKVGDDTIQWPEKLPQQRVQSSTRTGAIQCIDGCNPVPGRVQLATDTGAIPYQDGCNSLPSEGDGCNPVPGRVQSSTTTIKESELKEELKDSLSIVRTAVPDQLMEFDRILRESGVSGYEPSRGYYQKVLTKYANILDIEEEALGMVSWLQSPPRKGNKGSPQSQGRSLSTRFVLGWLQRSLERRDEDRRNNHAVSSNSPSGNRTNGHNTGASNAGNGLSGETNGARPRTWTTDISDGAREILGL